MNNMPIWIIVMLSLLCIGISCDSVQPLRGPAGSVVQASKEDKIEAIINGIPVWNISEVPWHAGITERPSRVSNKWPYSADCYCGATLIDSKWAVTAAHCLWNYVIYQGRKRPFDLKNNDEVYVFANSHRLDFEQQILAVDSIIIHPRFEPELNKLHNDIALLYLKDSVDELYPNQFARLPSDVTEHEALLKGKAGDSLFITGWGSVDPADHEAKSIELLKTHVSVETFSKCKSNYERYRNHIFSDSMFCAVGTVSDACFGDSGGPLYTQREVGVLLGIISFGDDKCDSPGFPGVYTNVGYYLDWIKSSCNNCGFVV